MTTHMERRHWLERCVVQDEHWDQSPWLAQMAQMDSDIEQEDDDDNVNEDERWLPRQRPARRNTPAQSSPKAVPSQIAFKPLHPVRSTSHRQHKSMSEIIPRRRHARSQSIPEAAAAQRLHIDTILPLQLPPTNLCTLSPLSTYPTTWWSSSAAAATASDESLRRSDSTNSFLSASSDGSWHGDHGDQDPNGQLERAISHLSISGDNIQSMDKKKMHNNLILSTYDYEDQDDIFESIDKQHTDFETCIDNDTEAEAIRIHAGPLMNNVASFFLEALTSYYADDDASSSSSYTSSLSSSSLQKRTSSHQALYGSISSTNDLGMESKILHQYRRQRAETMPSGSTTAQQQQQQNQYGQQQEEVSTSSLQSLLQWFLPSVDEKLERELLGHHESRPRLESIPSLYSDTSETEREDDEDDDDDDDNSITPGSLHIHRQMESEQNPMYHYNIKSRRSSVSKSLKRRSLSILDTSGAPSPLWDNRLVEEPYQRSWSSVMNLASL